MLAQITHIILIVISIKSFMYLHNYTDKIFWIKTYFTTQYLILNWRLFF